MPEQFTCPRCGKVITVAFVHPESQVICPDCRIALNVTSGAGDRPWGPPAEAVGGPGAMSPGPGGAAPAAQKTSGLAVTSMILGIGSLPLSCCYGFGILAAIAGLILGVVALKQIKRSRGAIRGRGMAKAGVVLSIIVILVVIALVIVAVIFGVKLGPELMSTVSQMESMTRIGAACCDYASSNNSRFPDALQDLVGQGYTTSVTTDTGDAYVYVGKGLVIGAAPGTIIAFSEKSGFMGTHAVIMGNGQATMLPREALAGMLRKQGVPEDLIP